MALVSLENLTRFYTKLKEKIYLKTEVDTKVSELNDKLGNCTFSSDNNGAYVTYTKNGETITKKLGSSEGTATASQVLSGATFNSSVSDDIQTGTMANQGAVSQSLNCGGSYTIPAGYHNGSGKITANSLSSQTSANATAARILSGYTAWVNGTKITGTMANQGAASKTLNPGGSYTIPAGYHNGSGKVTANTDKNLVAGNIKSGVKIFGVTGNYTGTPPKVLDSYTYLKNDRWWTFNRTFNKTVSKGSYLCLFNGFQHTPDWHGASISLSIGKGTVTNIYNVVRQRGNEDWGVAGHTYAALVTCTADSVLKFSVSHYITQEGTVSYAVIQL